MDFEAKTLKPAMVRVNYMLIKTKKTDQNDQGRGGVHATLSQFLTPLVQTSNGQNRTHFRASKPRNTRKLSNVLTKPTLVNKDGVSALR